MLPIFEPATGRRREAFVILPLLEGLWSGVFIILELVPVKSSACDVLMPKSVQAK